MPKFWKTFVQRNDEDLVLYTFTSDEAIKRDLDAGEPGSLIMFIRNMKRRDNPTDASNHLDLACGVFFHHSDRSGYKQADPSIMEVDSIPNGIKEFPIGGNSNEGYLKIATCVYEEAILH